ncbi:hypothetical protein FEE95_01905 [Maribacter algarum]|uniref:Uncharacterized protein n=1 Tax=Maribacter algarum (ex Zhang et al. 2020) TaxID=2578118 RepID=A0A5S3PT79_9FLAO|nr:hypothetical protein [Maribacter algarum]TMM58205.1 hypothetical protein FEE95_01905 [Maribacter algarum]
MTDNPHESYLRPFFEAMNNEFHSEWCVLHSYETLPFFSSSDVDMAFGSTNVSKLEKLIVNIGELTGWSLYQKLWYDIQYCFYYVLKKDNEDIFLALDFLIDPKGIGKYSFKTNTLVHNCNRFNEIIPIPNNEIACCYKVVKRVVKKRSLEQDDRYIRNHFKLSDSKAVLTLLRQHFKEESTNLLMNYLKGTKEKLDEYEIIELNNSRLHHISSMGKRVQYILWNTYRILNRILAPKGMILHIPNLESKELDKFVSLLNAKVDILFRFVELSRANSFMSNFKAITGSTLIIQPEERFNPEKAVRTHWLNFKNASVPLDKKNEFSLSIDEMVDIYYHAILDNLPNRFHIDG